MKIISLTQNNFQTTVEIAAQTIQKGGVVLAPTDTVYGLLANATDENAIKKIYKIKNRPFEKPLPIFVKNMAMAKKLAKISNSQEKKLEEKWPGKFTAILVRKNNIKIFGAKEKTIALRIPSYPFVNSLLETLNLPLCGTSANISGMPAQTEIDKVLHQFSCPRDSFAGCLPDLIVNAGDLSPANPSTIVDLTGKTEKIIR